MMYNSTRNSAAVVSSAQAISRGISEEGGLFVPQEIPALSAEEIKGMISLGYDERAYAVLSKFLTDFSEEELKNCVTSAYGKQFRHPKVAPLYDLGSGVQVMELWHGPTCAFKDMALQILPHFMRVSAQKTVDGKEIVILVATSGDTGKAALEGFKDAPDTRILVFYPEDGVSPMQKLQMTTQEGNNVGVCAIEGNFDDAQTGVKKIFTDPAMAQELANNNKMFSSANSINWGRLAPQIVYYVSAYCDMLEAGTVSMGEPVNVVVPTGNFGNILAAYYAKKMGVPIAKLICASNANRVLTDFLETGEYNRNRAFYTTTSPSMDILISSNLERLLYELSGRDDALIATLMKQLNESGSYRIPETMREEIRSLFAAGSCTDAQTAETIGEVYREKGYLLDPHTAVAVRVYEEYVAKTGDKTPTVIASTANPYKFSASVLAALGEDDVALNEFEKMVKLNAVTGCEIPEPLASIQGKTQRFKDVCTKETMVEVVKEMLDL